MKLSEIVYNIKNLVNGGRESDDTTISNEQIVFIVNYYRAKLIKQDQDKGRTDKALYVQNLGEVSLIQADKNECCGECILRTELKLPTPLETYKGLNITFVGTLNGRPFDQQTHNSSWWNRAAKYTGKEPKWYLQNGYIYILNPPTLALDTINIQGIFEDPVVAESFKRCDCVANVEVGCDSVAEMDYDYPLPMHHVDTIVKLISQTEMRSLLAFPNDVTNDSKDN